MATKAMDKVLRSAIDQATNAKSMTSAIPDAGRVEQWPTWRYEVLRSHLRFPDPAPFSLKWRCVLAARLKPWSSKPIYATNSKAVRLPPGRKFGATFGGIHLPSWFHGTGRAQPARSGSGGTEHIGRP